MEANYNMKNPAVRRIFKEYKELKASPSQDFLAFPFEEDIFMWHFAVKGPQDTPFAGGLYHGRIILPAEYPYKPPGLIFETKNGRFKTDLKICLSITDYHPESWQPSWGIRTLLTALISFFPVKDASSFGAILKSDETRRQLAKDSQKPFLKVKQINNLLNHPSNNYAKGIGLLYLRYVGKSDTLWDWFSPYFDSEDEVVLTSGPLSKSTTIGKLAESLLKENKYLNTNLPRIPVPIQRKYIKQLDDYERDKKNPKKSRKYEEDSDHGTSIETGINLGLSPVLNLNTIEDHNIKTRVILLVTQKKKTNTMILEG
ncbi:hypothetical protein BB560_000959 [Smittium megazygosporum]|uniref:Pre-mRNA-splicing factor 38 n=1 Tax=Smittium megazygosporum TaxID=133381 RepID=A0A2T9ZIW4_9FUNG|nr:hypothetical protein BB560_000959 [Smittium megazygosporum]